MNFTYKGLSSQFTFTKQRATTLQQHQMSDLVGQLVEIEFPAGCASYYNGEMKALMGTKALVESMTNNGDYRLDVDFGKHRWHASWLRVIEPAPLQVGDNVIVNGGPFLNVCATIVRVESVKVETDVESQSANDIAEFENVYRIDIDNECAQWHSTQLIRVETVRRGDLAAVRDPMNRNSQTGQNVPDAVECCLATNTKNGYIRVIVMRPQWVSSSCVKKCATMFRGSARAENNVGCVDGVVETLDLYGSFIDASDAVETADLPKHPSERAGGFSTQNEGGMNMIENTANPVASFCVGPTGMDEQNEHNVEIVEQDVFMFPLYKQSVSLFVQKEGGMFMDVVTFENDYIYEIETKKFQKFPSANLKLKRGVYIVVIGFDVGLFLHMLRAQYKHTYNHVDGHISHFEKVFLVTVGHTEIIVCSSESAIPSLRVDAYVRDWSDGNWPAQLEEKLMSQC